MFGIMTITFLIYFKKKPIYLINQHDDNIVALFLSFIESHVCYFSMDVRLALRQCCLANRLNNFITQIIKKMHHILSLDIIVVQLNNPFTDVTS